MTLHLNESGPAGAPTIVFLHGAGSSSWMWHRQIENLTEFLCLAVDLPGHGESHRIPWVSLVDTAAQVADVIRSRATGGQAYVVGLSLGAYVALDLLTRNPSLVKRAVVSGFTAAPLKSGPLTRLQVRAVSYFLHNAWLARSQAKMLHVPDAELAGYTASMRNTSRQAFVRVFEEVSNFNLPFALHNVAVPTLAVAGSEEAPEVRAAVSALVRLMPSAEGRFAPNLHHAWNGESPDLFTAMLRAWFTGEPLPAGLTVADPTAA